MARTREKTNRSSGKEAFDDYDFKRMKHMNAEEIMAYLDKIEPVSDDEVERFFERIAPKTSSATESLEPQRRKSFRFSAKTVVWAAVCLTLVFSLAAQALGMNVWGAIVSWTSELLVADISSTGEKDVPAQRNAFTAAERETWGDDVCNAFEELGIYPELPTWKPEGMKLDELVYYNREDRMSVKTFYVGEDNMTLRLAVDVIHGSDTKYQANFERDSVFSRIYEIDGVQYYMTSNSRRYRANWFLDNMSLSISGSIDYSDLEKMIYSIGKEGETP